MLPKIKKVISAFLTEEEGRISKKVILAGGAMLAASAALSGSSTAHSQNIVHSESSSLTYGQGAAKATHSHYDPAHSSHSSHGSHGAHGNHSSHGSHGSHGNHTSHSSSTCGESTKCVH